MFFVNLHKYLILISCLDLLLYKQILKHVSSSAYQQIGIIYVSDRQRFNQNHCCQADIKRPWNENFGIPRPFGSGSMPASGPETARTSARSGKAGWKWDWWMGSWYWVQPISAGSSSSFGKWSRIQVCFLQIAKFLCTILVIIHQL